MGLSAISGILHHSTAVDGSQTRLDSDISDKKHDQYQEGYAKHAPAKNDSWD
jgi:hypothetical protein